MKKLIVVLFILATLLTGCGVVESYETGMVSKFGKIVEDNISPGLCFYNPFVSDLIRVDLREVV